MIYVVEDDDNIRELVLYTLNHSGLEAEGFSKPSAFFAALDKKKPRMVVLDIMLPEEDGLSVLKKLRRDAATVELPVMMLTAKSSEYDKVLGLDLGADDYMPKPFGMMELVARIKALLRRSERTSEKKEYTVQNLFVCVERHLVTVDGERVPLTKKEFDLLCMLLKNVGRVLTRDQLLNEIWGYCFDGENRTVDVHIRTLRQKLGSAGALIETIRGVGYTLKQS